MHKENLTRYAVAPALFLALACGAGADPLSKKADIDFYRDVLSRDLHGMASRSGRPRASSSGALNPVPGASGSWAAARAAGSWR